MVAEALDPHSNELFARLDVRREKEAEVAVLTGFVGLEDEVPVWGSPDLARNNAKRRSVNSTLRGGQEWRARGFGRREVS